MGGRWRGRGGLEGREVDRGIEREARGARWMGAEAERCGGEG